MLKLGFALVAIGLLVLLGWVAKAFFAAPEIPLVFRAAGGAVGLGLILLLVSAARDRYRAYKKENFREIER